MRINTQSHLADNVLHATSPKQPGAGGNDKLELRKAFDSFVGQTLFGEMLRSMRKSLGEPAYFHGGQAEKIFTQQLDQVLAERITEASAEKITGPMFELFMPSRR